MQFYKNPFYLYVISFLVIVIIYQLGWSSLYPKLTIWLIVFFIITAISSLFLGGTIDKYNPIQYKKATGNTSSKRVILGIYILLACEFIYNKGIPLLMVFKNPSYDYIEFGIPTLHPILVTFTSFYTVYVFHVVLSEKKKRDLIKLIILLVFPILIYNRGMLMISLVSGLMVYLMSIKKIKYKIFAYITVLVLILLFLFGVLGNYRLTGGSSNEYFLEVAEATESFKDSRIPEEYFWSYIYITSPLANLQNNINENKPEHLRVKDFFLTELIPDFVSKRIAGVFHAERGEISQIAGFLNVGTIYSRSYSLLGWFGIYLMYFFIAGFVLLYIIILKRSNKYYVTGIAILNTFIIFNSFTNMIYFSGISFQLVYPIIFGIFKLNITKYKIRIR